MDTQNKTSNLETDLIMTSTYIYIMFSSIPPSWNLKKNTDLTILSLSLLICIEENQTDMKKDLNQAGSDVDKSIVMNNWLFGEDSLSTKMALLLNLNSYCCANLRENGDVWLSMKHNQSVVVATDI